MRRLSSHWLLNLLMILVLAMASPVVAGGHHGDASCLESIGMELSTTADPGEPDATLASSCCMPCIQCGATMGPLAVVVLVSSLPLSESGFGHPSGPPVLFERPPRA